MIIQIIKILKNYSKEIKTINNILKLNNKQIQEKKTAKYF